MVRICSHGPNSRGIWRQDVPVVLTHNIPGGILACWRYRRPAVRSAGNSRAIRSQRAGINEGSPAMGNRAGRSSDASGTETVARWRA